MASTKQRGGAPLVDTHCHIDFDGFDGDRDEVLSRAEEAGVAQIICIGCAQDPEGPSPAIELARRHPDRMRATIGVHPHDASRASEALLARVEALSADPLVVAVGEIGLDFHYDNSPRAVQLEAFRRQVALASRAQKPIVVHTRNAPRETLEILHDEGGRDVGGVIHCFSEDAAFASAALDLGFIASFSGLITFGRNTEAIREAARAQPADALMVETDAPYLAPVPHRGARNEPAFVAHTAAALADLRGEDVHALRQQTTDNARRLFGLPGPQ